MEIKLGQRVQTPRFLTVTIKAMFLDIGIAESNDFTEPTHFRDGDYYIRGKSIGYNCMIFAAIRRNPEDNLIDS